MILSPGVGNLPPDNGFDLQGQGRCSHTSDRFVVTWAAMAGFLKKFNVEVEAADRYGEDLWRTEVWGPKEVKGESVLLTKA